MREEGRVAPNQVIITNNIIGWKEEVIGRGNSRYYPDKHAPHSLGSLVLTLAHLSPYFLFTLTPLVRLASSSAHKYRSQPLSVDL